MKLLWYIYVHMVQGDLQGSCMTADKNQTMSHWQNVIVSMFQSKDICGTLEKKALVFWIIKYLSSTSLWQFALRINHRILCWKLKLHQRNISLVVSTQYCSLKKFTFIIKIKTDWIEYMCSLPRDCFFT